MLIANVGKIVLTPMNADARFTPTYVFGSADSDAVPSTRPNEWKKITWAVQSNMTEEKDVAYIVANIWNFKDEIAVHLEYELCIVSGYIKNFHTFSAEPFFSMENAHECIDRTLTKRLSKDAFWYVKNLTTYFKKVHDLEIDRANERLRLKMLQQEQEMQDALQLPSAAEQGEKNAKRMSAPYTPTKEHFFDPNVPAKVQNAKLSAGRAYNPHTYEWQVRSHVRHYKRKDGKEWLVEIPAHTCKRKKKKT